MNKYLFFSLFFLVLVGYLFLHYPQSVEITRGNIDLILYVLIPSLFPAMILISLLKDLGVFYLLGYLLQFISIPLFNINGLDMSIVLSSLGGAPLPGISAKQVNPNRDYSDLISLFSFPSLAFILSNIHLKGYSSGMMYISFFLAGFLVLFCKSGEKVQYISYQELKMIIATKMIGYSFFKSLKSSIRESGGNFLIISGNLMFFSLFLVFYNSPYFLGFFEFSRSAISLNVDSLFSYCMLIVILLFNGLSVMMQYLAICPKFSLKVFLLNKIYLINGALLINIFYLIIVK